MASPSFERKKAELANAFVARLPATIDKLHSDWESLSTIHWDRRILRRVRASAHDLAGTGETFNVPAIGDLARMLEGRLSLISGKDEVGDEDSKAVRGLLCDLRESVDELIAANAQAAPAVDDVPLLSADTEINVAPAVVSLSNHGEKRVALLEADAVEAAKILPMLHSRDLLVEVFTNPAALRVATKERQFHVILADLLIPDCPLTSAISVEEFLYGAAVGQTKGVPVIMLSRANDVSMRLIALRAGIKSYISLPVDKQELLKKIDDIFKKQETNLPKVLIVDDDSALTEYYEAALNEEGFIISTISDPLTALDHIDSFKPDILLLDYLMPECNGLELAEILRGDPRYSKLPILFISACGEAIKKKGLLGVVGNAFLEKPVSVELLRDTLYQQITTVKAFKEKVESVSMRASAKHLENRDYFISLLADALAEKNTARNQYKRCLIYATLQNRKRCIATLNEEERDLLDARLEDYLAANDKFTISGCNLRDFCYLLMMEFDPLIDEKDHIRHFKTSIYEQKMHISGVEQYARFDLGVLMLDGMAPSNVDDAILRVEQANRCAADSAMESVIWVDLAKENKERVNLQRQLEEQKREDDDRQRKENQHIISALKDKSFQLMFQSIVKPESDDHIFEVLARLVDVDGNMYSPQKFLPFLRENVQDGPYTMDRWVIDNAFKSLENASGLGSATFSIIIKLSPDLDQVERLLPFIYNTVSNCRLRGSRRIFFALPESVAIGHVEKISSIIESIDNVGCGFVLEQCLANGDSVQLLRDLPEIDFIKLHSSVGAHNDSLMEVRSKIENMQRVVGMRTHIIAGVVEDAKTFASYWDLNVRYFQGYFIHRPNSIMQYSPMKDDSVVMDR